MHKVALVTGASSGIGWATAQLLVQRGYRVYGTSRKPQSTGSAPFTWLQLDVTDLTSIHQGVAQLIAVEGRIDVLINNAGVGVTGPVEGVSPAHLQLAFATNVFGPMQLAQVVLPYMRAQGSGVIVQVTSIAGRMGLPYRGVYSATKSALERLSEAMRMEVAGFGVRVVTLLPGDVSTSIAQHRLHTEPDEVPAYRRPYSHTLNVMNQGVDRGKSANELALKIFKVIEIENDRPHYLYGGFMEKCSTYLKACLPDKMFERLLKNHYKL